MSYADDMAVTWHEPGPVEPREVEDNPRCPKCKTGPMFHPAHRWGPCQVQPTGEEVCGCTYGQDKSPRQQRGL